MKRISHETICITYPIRHIFEHVWQFAGFSFRSFGAINCRMSGLHGFAQVLLVYDMSNMKPGTLVTL